LVGQVISSTRQTFLADQLGSVVTVINENGTKANEYRYKPFGADLEESGSKNNPHRMRWIGALGYQDTNLPMPSHYVKARFYSEEIGNWTTNDPLSSAILRGLGQLGGLALLHFAATGRTSYVHNNPTNMVDPLGLMAVNPTPDRPWGGGGSPQPVTPPGGPIKEPDPNNQVIGGCLNMSIKIPIKTPWPVSIELSVKVKICMTLFDPTCCPGPAATYCRSIEIEVSLKVSLEIPGLDIFDMLDEFDEFWLGLMSTFNNLVQAMLGFLVDTAFPPAKTCKKPGTKIDWSLCVEAKLDCCKGSACYDGEKVKFDGGCSIFGCIAGLEITITGKVTIEECK
jgi:RHS repeat-associated protein